MMDQQVLSQKPHLCFIEYATGDMGVQVSGDEIGAAVEGMVRKLIASNCAVVFLYLYRTDQDFAGANSVIAAYESVAAHYGLPSVNVGAVIQESIGAGLIVQNDFVRDKVHTTPEGSRLTAEYIERGLEAVFEVSATTVEPVLPSRLFSRSYERTEVVPATTAMLQQPVNCISGRFRFAYDYVQVDNKNEIRFTPDGELTGLLVIVGKDAGIISVETSGASGEYTLWDEWCQYNRVTTVILREPVSSGTRVTIRLTDKTVDYPEAHGESFNRRSPKRFTLIGFLVRCISDKDEAV
jgi:hypothetical protein